MAGPLQRTPSGNLLIEESELLTAKPPSVSMKVGGMARHTLGLLLLLAVVFLWTASNFLGSSIFADNTYAKPFFLTYLNTTCFMLAAVPGICRSAHQKRREGKLSSSIRKVITKPWHSLCEIWTDKPEEEGEPFFKPDEDPTAHQRASTARLLTTESTRFRRMRTHLGFKSTARLSFTFCILWFSANYFAMACLQYTTVASTTILTSTSAIWTLLIGTFTHMEKFTWRKLLGVFASLIGIMIISSKDLTATGPGPHGGAPGRHNVRQTTKFPTKRPAELALGDALALTSAIIYGAYTITLKRTTIKAAPLQLNMPLFFGLVGFFNAVLLFPLFPVLSWTGLEPFQLPPSKRIWTILMCNAVSSLLSDICWAYAMVLTSPLIVTVGLSLTIPVSLVGEMIIQGRFEGLVYWIGAIIVVSSFVFVDQEEMKDEPAPTMPVFDEGPGEEGLIAAQADEASRMERESDEILR